MSTSATPPRSASSSSAVTASTSALRSIPKCANGCLSKPTMATGSPGRSVASSSSCSNVPCGVAESGVPAESSAMMPKRDNSVVTRRARFRSGVISAARLSPSLPGRSSARRSAMAMAVASSRSLPASINETSANAEEMAVSGSLAFQAPHSLVASAGERACDRISLRCRNASAGSASGTTSSRVRPSRFRS